MHTASFLITIIQAIIHPVTDFGHFDAVPIVTLKIMWSTGGFWCDAEVFELVGFVTAVVVPITDVGL